jgi:hypothetical protein
VIALIRELFVPSLEDMGSIDPGHLERVLEREDMDGQRLPEPIRERVRRSVSRIERPHWWKESA